MWEKIKPYIKTYAVAIAIPIAVGLLSALFTKDSMDIYEEIIVPPLAPPSWLFPIAWGILYVLMGISSGLVYTKKEISPEAARVGLTTYAVSLVINFAWSLLFFNAGAFLLSFIWLLLLLYTIIRTIYYYRKVYNVAAYLQIPYVLWVIFAGYLNFSIWLMN